MTPQPPPLLQLLEALARAISPAGGDAATTGAGPDDPDRPAGAGGTTFDDARLLLTLFEEGQRINTALFRLFVQPQLRAQMAILRQMVAGGSTNGNDHVDQPAEDDLFEMLSSAQIWIVQNPVAAQAVFSKLVAEGRHFAETDVGARWAKALAESDLVRKGRLVWETVTLNLLEERPESVIPRTYLEVLRKTVASKNFEDLLSGLRQGERKDEP